MNRAVTMMRTSGTETSTTQAPTMMLMPPTSSTSDVIHATMVCAGMPIALRIVPKLPGPLLSFAYPCDAKPKPTTRRSGRSQFDESFFAIFKATSSARFHSRSWRLVRNPELQLATEPLDSVWFFRYSASPPFFLRLQL